MEEIGFSEIYTMRKNTASLWKWFLSVATLQMKYKVIMTVQMQMFYLFQVVKKQLIEPRNTKKEYRSKYYKEKMQNP